MSKRVVNVGGVKIGGAGPIVVQSMTNTNTADLPATIEQINRLQQAGCEIVRVAVPDMATAKSLPDIKKTISIPLVADIHFDFRLALAAIEAGVDKLRLNPGNITDKGKITDIVEAAKDAKIPIRVGANSGSLAPEFLDQQHHATASGLVESAMSEVRLLEELGFCDIVISVKGSDVPMTVDAYRQISAKVDYPLHIGITESGTPWEGSIRSAVGLGVLLAGGIGDTLRVSLAGDPVPEIHAAYAILRALGLRKRGIDFRVCPTCGRTNIDLVTIAENVQRELQQETTPVTVALMGCVVNGIGEAREADVGLVGGKSTGTVYVHGEICKRSVPEQDLRQEVVNAVRQVVALRRSDEQSS